MSHGRPVALFRVIGGIFLFGINQEQYERSAGALKLPNEGPPVQNGPNVCREVLFMAGAGGGTTHMRESSSGVNGTGSSFHPWIDIL